MAEILAALIDEKGSRRAFAEEIGLPPTTLQSMLTRGLGRASVGNVIKACRALGITVEELEKMASGDTNRSNDEQTSSEMSDEEIITLAAHRIGHEGELSEEQLSQIKLAVRIALAKDKK